jgi:hypothetical protein
MSKQPDRQAFTRALAASQSDEPAERPDLAFAPALRRSRRDGWTPEKQAAFIDALAESGCVNEACARVGMSPSSAYALRRTIEAASFRAAWDAALDYAIRRLSDAAFSRALHGVARPVFFQGEQIGERRYYDERLTLFLLRYRDPLRYAKTLDEMIYSGVQEGAAFRLFRASQQAQEDAWMAEDDEDDEGAGEGEVEGDVV